MIFREDTLIDILEKHGFHNIGSGTFYGYYHRTYHREILFDNKELSIKVRITKKSIVLKPVWNIKTPSESGSHWIQVNELTSYEDIMHLLPEELKEDLIYVIDEL